MSKDNEVYIVNALRTPVCKAHKGGFANIRPDDLLAHVLKGVLANIQLPSDDIDDVIIGCAMPEAEQGMNIARISCLLAGYSNKVPAMTINRFCSSGLQSISLAADRIKSGAANVIIAGGVESMSMVPLGGHNYRANMNIFKDDNVAIAYGMGITAEIVAEKWGISRQMQDEFAYNSHLKALSAIEQNHFKNEILPYSYNINSIKSESLNSKQFTISMDDGPRQDTSIEKLASLRPVFKNNGSVTAGNSSQMSDGAAAILLMNKESLKKYNCRPIAKFNGFAVTGVAPEVMGVGPITAIPKCLNDINLKLDDIGWFELNEAFAAQSLAVINELQLDQNKVNPYGGAISLGHPLGATGAIKATTLIHGIQNTNTQYGMVTMCIGTGMGAAGIFEKV